MHSELIIQEKYMRELTYLRRNQPATTSQFFFNKKNAIWKKHHMQGKIKHDDANTEKQSLDLLSLSSPINTCKDLQTKYRGQKQSTTGS
jgi:hypothetical protein